MKWIWAENEHPNQYVEFVREFAVPDPGKASEPVDSPVQGKAPERDDRARDAETPEYRMRISADTEYVVWLNGSFVANGQYGDFPYYKVYDEIDVTGFIRKGTNRLAVLAWHMGMDTLMHYKKRAGIWFEVLDCEGNKLVQSGPDTGCRISRAYRQDISYKITSQLGYAWGYDCGREDNWKEAEAEGFAPAVQWEDSERLYPRPVAKCKTESVTEGRVIAQGIYRNSGDEDRNPAQRVQTAWLQTRRFEEMTGLSKLNVLEGDRPVPFRKDAGDGIYVVVDLKEECAGYPVLELETTKSCKMYLAVGEHLADLRVRAEVGGRYFAFEIGLEKGMNRFAEYTRRIAGRYLMLLVETDGFVLHRAGILNSEYPFNVKERYFADRLMQKIYDTGVRTLKLCAHEHYEDCPWREQALYGMDSRNQMLFGYSVFEEYEYPRASLRLLAYSQKKNGLLAICAPSGVNLTIPSFSQYWLLAVCENAEVDFQEDFVREMLPYGERLRECFAGQLGPEGIRRFPGAGMWNFHEWIDGLSGKEALAENATDLVATALFYLTMKKMAVLEGQLGREDERARCEALADEAKKAAEAFYNPQTGLYASYLSGGEPVGLHGYTLSLLVCSGIVPKEREAALAGALRQLKNTFATLPWRYEALLSTGVSSVDEIVEEICGTFGALLFDGATTLPETVGGEADFSEAGSMCHGWSAVPCYIFDRYVKEEK